MTTICLSMIVRNEAHVIARCLRSVRPHITHWAINDTGSAGGTQDIIRRELAGLPGELIERPWVDDFAHSRNEALDLARSTGAEYVLFLDADEELVWPDRAPTLTQVPLAGSDVFFLPQVMQHSGETVNRGAIIRADSPYRWKGRLHERLDPGWTSCPGRIDGVWIHNHHDAASMRDPVAKARDRVRILESMLREEPTNAGWCHYLGREFHHAREPEKAIHAYEASARFGGDSEWTFISLFQIGRVKLVRGEPLGDVLAAFERATLARPWRFEPHWAAALALDLAGRFQAAERSARSAIGMRHRLNDVCFPVGRSTNDWKLWEEVAVGTAALARFPEAVEIYTRILREPDLTPKQRRDIEAEVVAIQGRLAREVAHA